jgi:hypothetical protein
VYEGGGAKYAEVLLLPPAVVVNCSRVDRL